VDIPQSHRLRSDEEPEQTDLRCVHLCSSQRPQPGMTGLTPIDAPKNRQRQRPEASSKRVCNLAGCDSQPKHISAAPRIGAGTSRSGGVPACPAADHG
jgi:hypothetical protein